jgi:hypothetical protein
MEHQEMIMSMTEIEPTALESVARELTDGEVADITGGSITHAGIAAISMLERINFKFLGCSTTENGYRACKYIHDALPDDM